MRILIDGDACPVKSIIYSIALKYGIEVVNIVSVSHFSDKNDKGTIYVDSYSQSADIELINRARRNDIVITGDYGLASICLAKGCYCLSFLGKIINDYNIDQLLNIRFLNQKIMSGGGRVKGPPKRAREDDDRFIRNLETIILRLKDTPQLETNK